MPSSRVYVERSTSAVQVDFEHNVLLQQSATPIHAAARHITGMRIRNGDAASLNTRAPARRRRRRHGIYHVIVCPPVPGRSGACQGRFLES